MQPNDLKQFERGFWILVILGWLVYIGLAAFIYTRPGFWE